jgi:uncharacterized protein (TIGR02444 family)
VTSLWDFAVELYGAPSVGEACLALQDRHGCDVNVILFAAWMGAVRGDKLSQPDMAEAIACVQSWRDEIVRPLRLIRRRLKSGPPPAPYQTTEELRTRIKAVELESERIELAQLEAFPSKRLARADEPSKASRENLMTAVRLFKGGELDAEARQLIEVIQSAVAAKIAARAG